MTNRSSVVAVLLLVTVPLAAAADFVSKEKGFRVTFPAPARELPPTPATQFGPDVAAFKQWLVEMDPGAYTVAATDWKQFGSPDDDELLDRLKDNTISSYEGAQLKGERFVALDGRAGREIDFDLPNGIRLTTQLFLDRSATRSINVTAIVPKTELGHPTVRAFLDSFRFLTPIEKTMYQAKDGAFTAVFPGPVSERPMATPQGTGSAIEAAVDGRSFNVTWLDTKTAFDGDMQQRLDNARDGVLRRVEESRLVSEADVMVSGRPARDLRLDAAGNMTLFNRIVPDAKRQRFYSLMVISRKPRADAAAAAAFFDTFRIADDR